MKLSQIIEALSNGAVLHLTLADKPTWKLNNGTTERTASCTAVQALRKRGVIAEPGDSLFAEIPSQTWRYAEPKEPDAEAVP